MFKNNYSFILALVLLTASCTQSPENENKSTSTTDNGSSIEKPDPIVSSSAEEIVVDEQDENTIPKIKKKSAAKSAPLDNDTADEAYPSGSINITNSYLIIQSTISYSAAEYTAKSVSEKLGIPIDYRGYAFDFKQGLKSTETCGCGEVHGYIPRGRNDDGMYVSIEHTSSFNKLQDGEYLVVAASGKKKNLTSFLTKTQKLFKNAHIVEAEVYIGCLH